MFGGQTKEVQIDGYNMTAEVFTLTVGGKRATCTVVPGNLPEVRVQCAGQHNTFRGSSLSDSDNVSNRDYLRGLIQSWLDAA